MSHPSRSALIARLQKVLKKHYKPVAADPNRSVMEQLIFACCLENAHYDVAEEAFAALVHNFFDWNEVRVSTVRELAEEMARLPDATAAAGRVKRVLQSVFEGSYSFDLEDLRKQNLGAATEKLAKYAGVTPFAAAYVVQAALGGHAIPVDQGVLQSLHLVGLISEEEAHNGQVGGLERAVPKPKGMEVGSQLHQLGADFTANPYSPTLQEILLEIEPASADRLPKRRLKKQTPGPAEAPAQEATAGAGPAKKKRAVKKPADETPPATEQAPAKPAEQPAARPAESRPAKAKAAEAKAEAKESKAEVKESKAEAKESKAAGKASDAATSKPAKPAATKEEVKPPEAKSAETKPASAKTAAPKAHDVPPEEAKAPRKKHAPKESKESPAAPKTADAETAADPPATKKKGPTTRKESPDKKDVDPSEPAESARKPTASAGLTKRKPR